MDALPRDCEEASCNQPLCTDSSAWAFARVRVRPTFKGGTVVDWILHPTFTDPEPHTYQLQWGQTDANSADDWVDVGAPAENAFTLTDDTQRAWGHVQRTNYRVKLSTILGEYISRPQHALGDLTPREWRLALNRERIWRVQFERTIRGQPGFLLKRKIHGIRPTPDQKILDWQTDEVIQAQAEETVGAEFIGGYYAPVCCDVDVDNFSKNERLGNSRGMTNDTAVGCEMLAVPMPDAGDVWVSKLNDFRWRIGGIKHLEEFNGVPVVLRAQLTLLPFNHISYTIPVG
jgi:hypothetical protein